MSETWLPVPGYEHAYEVSDHGRVRSVDRPVRGNGGGTYIRRGKVLSPSRSKKGYLRLSLRVGDGSVYLTGVHRLVLLAFVGPCPPGMEALHANDNASDNRLENLRWGTASENTFDKIRNGRHQQTRKTHCPQGHAYSAENTYHPPSNPRWRQCRACRKTHSTNFDLNRKNAR